MFDVGVEELLVSAESPPYAFGQDLLGVGKGVQAKREDPLEDLLEEAKKQSATKAANRLRRSESQVPIGKKGLMDHDRHRTTTTVRETYKDPEGGAKPSGAAGG